MTTRSWIRNLFARTPRAVRKVPARYRLRLEALEERLAPANLVVTSAADPVTLTAGTLRYAINQANAHAATGISDAITFNTTAMGTGLITLKQGVLELKAGAGKTTIAGAGHVTLDGNQASAVFLIDAGATDALSGLTIQHGKPSGNGGGINNNGALTLTGCTISDNTVSAGIGAGGGGGAGGGIYNTGTLTVAGTTISGNSATAGGGGIENDGGTLTVTNSTISDNTDGGIDSFAAGFGHVAAMTVAASTLSGNTDGGIENDANSTATVTNSTIFDNTGGGIANSGRLTVTASTIADNSGKPSLAAASPGGIFNLQGIATLADTIVAGNTGTGPDTDVAGGFRSLGYNLIGNVGNSTGWLSTGPNADQTGSSSASLLSAGLASALGSNGGPTQTLTLQANSPAIGKGGAVTTLRATPSNPGRATTLSVADAATIASTPGQYYIVVDGEEMEVTNVDTIANTLTVTRDIGGVSANLAGGDGVYLFTDQRGFIRATPPDIGAYEYTAGASVAEVPLTAGSLTPPVAVEGQPVSAAVLFHFSDADPDARASDYVALVNWGDNTSQTSLTDPGSVQVVANPSGGFDVIGSHTCSEEGSSLPFKVSVGDIGGAAPIASSVSNFSVADAPLTAGTLTPPVATEGQPITGAVLLHFSDADPNAAAGDYTATVSWADGSVENSTANPGDVKVVANPSGGFDVIGSHSYRGALSSASFSVSVADHGAAPAANSVSNFSVADAPLTAGTLTPPAAVEGWAISNAVLFHFSDADPGGTASDYTATVTWGDGQVEHSTTSPSDVKVVANGNGGFDVVGSHTYSEEASGLTFSVAVQDTRGAAPTTASTSTFSVADAALTAGTLTAPLNPVPGTPTSSQVLFHFSDANRNATAADFTATVTWGDGTVEDNVHNPGTVAVVAAGGGFDVVGAHTYLQGGPLNFRVDVADRGGASTSDSGTVSVSSDAVVPGTAADDTLLLMRTPGGQPGDVTYTLNGAAPVALHGVTSFTFNGGAGNDTMTVSLANGGPLVSKGAVSFDGGTGVNTLILDAAGLPVRTMAGSYSAAGQAVNFSNTAVTHVNNTAAVDAFAGPDTADRATAFTGLTAPERFVQALYLDELGRAGSQAELDSWVNGQLNQPGGSQQAVVAAIAGSFEAEDHVVQSWYFAFLGHQAQGGEELAWVKLVQSGLSEEQVLRQILGDPGHEFYDRAQTLGFGGTADQNYVQALYQVLLNRRAGSSELDNGVAALQTMGRQGLALTLLDSEEFRGDQIAGYFATLLHRPANAAGLADWVASGLDGHGVRVAFESGMEFYSNG
jgi:hypothetical protein